MNWIDHMLLSECDVAAAPYGGPIAVMRKPMYLGTNSKQAITIYNAAGIKMSEIRWQEGGQIMKFAWSASEKLVVVQDDGGVFLFDIFGQPEEGASFYMGQEAQDLKIADCRIFPSFADTGVVVMTTAYRFWIKSDINARSPARKLADVPGLSAPPSSWTVLAKDGNMCGLVAKDDQLFFIDQLGQCTRQDIQIRDPNVISYTDMSVSLNGKYLALMTASGTVWIGSSDLMSCFSEFDSQRRNRPSQMVWCGTSSIVLYWENFDLLVVGPDRDSFTYDCDQHVVLVPEIDGTRVLSDDLHEFIERVPDVTPKIFDMVSTEPGSYLFEAERKFAQRNKEANDYLTSIEDQMGLAVEQCIEAAGHEYQTNRQKDLLRAASFGKCFVNTANPDQFYHMCQTIRVLNAVRDYTIGIPLTLKQLNILKLETLIDRLVYRRQYLLARKICQYLKLKDVEIRILAHWACYKVENEDGPDHMISSSIKEKLGDSSGVSYSDIAKRAIDRGKTQLAIMLLEHETQASAQIPLLLQMKKYEPALRKAIDSGDSNLIYQVIFELKERLQNMQDFLLEIRKSPTALTLYMKYCETENPQLLESLYHQEDRMVDVANCAVRNSILDQDVFDKKRHLAEAAQKYREAHDEWAAKATEDQVKLLEKQQQFESQGMICLHTSLHNTIHELLKLAKYKEADQMRKEFNVPDRRFWWIKVNALAEAGNWTELEAFSKSKKHSPIGFRPFVEACSNNGNKVEASKYLVRVAPDEKVKCLISIGEMEHAAEVAFERHNEDELNLVLQRCTISDKAVFDRVQRLKAQLRAA